MLTQPFYKCPQCPPPDCYSTNPTCARCGGKKRAIEGGDFVDSPGHESLMANMLSGSALMDGGYLSHCCK